MIRSRLLFVLLFLAYLGVTPAGVYTCACLLPAQTPLQAVEIDEISVQTAAKETAVANIINYFSLTFLGAAIFMLVNRRKFDHRRPLLLLNPSLFFDPPPTPPPHFA
jgi:hypothetical protein